MVLSIILWFLSKIIKYGCFIDYPLKFLKIINLEFLPMMSWYDHDYKEWSWRALIWPYFSLNPIYWSFIAFIWSIGMVTTSRHDHVILLYNWLLRINPLVLGMIALIQQWSDPIVVHWDIRCHYASFLWYPFSKSI